MVAGPREAYDTALPVFQGLGSNVYHLGPSGMASAVKLANKGVRVNSIAPGPFATDMMRYLEESPELKQQFTDTIPLGRMGGEADIKGVVVFLASEAAAFVTGSTLVVDGGMLAVDAFPAPRT